MIGSSVSHSAYQILINVFFTLDPTSRVITVFISYICGISLVKDEGSANMLKKKKKDEGRRFV